MYVSQRDEHGHIVGHDVEHELLFPLKQQYGPAAVDLVLIKKQELDHSANDLRPRTVSPLFRVWKPCSLLLEAAADSDAVCGSRSVLRCSGRMAMSWSRWRQCVA